MATKEKLESLDLMKDYFQHLLGRSGFELEARRFNGVRVHCTNSARCVAEMLRAMSLGYPPKEVMAAKRTLLSQIELLQ